MKKNKTGKTLVAIAFALLAPCFIAIGVLSSYSEASMTSSDWYVGSIPSYTFIMFIPVILAISGIILWIKGK